MIYQTTHVFDGSNSVNLVTLLGTDDVVNFTVRKINGEGSVYIGNENVSAVTFGLKLDVIESVYFPGISLKINPNLYLFGEQGVSASIFAWQ